VVLFTRSEGQRALCGSGECTTLAIQEACLPYRVMRHTITSYHILSECLLEAIVMSRDEAPFGAQRPERCVLAALLGSFRLTGTRVIVVATRW
jgi:hypothetical protein